MMLISPTEFVLMRCIWDLGAANAQQASEHLAQHYGRTNFPLTPSTIGIFLARLVKKGYLRSSPGLVGRGRPPHVYVPIVTFEDAFRLQIERFIFDCRTDAETLYETLKESFLSESEESVKPKAPRRRVAR